MGDLLVYTLGALGVWLVTRLARVGRRGPHLPDGPPTVPILGNLHIFPKVEAHLKLTEWARTYGGIYSLIMGPGTAIVLTDMTIVKDLMDKLSQATADRPPMYLADRVMGAMNLAFSRYNEDWRKLRRAAHETLTQQACTKHLSIQRAESAQLLHDCLVNPEGWYIHIKRFSASVILSVLYGKRAPRVETQEICDIAEMLHKWEEVLTPGAHPPVDFVPFLKYLPKSLASWKTLCATTRRMQRKIYFGLLSETEERMAQGHENGCFIEQVLARQSGFGLSREQIGYLSGVMIEAGSDTTAAWLQNLVLVLVAFPDAQKKAQAELDRVVGSDRIPTPEDFDHLPYIQAVVKECHRWRPVLPLAIPHATIEEINYRGFRIPAGTTIFINSWGISHDPDVHERPEDFWPDRWILRQTNTETGADDIDVRSHGWFGSGRRFCPGIHLANNSLIVNTMNLLWAFDFGPEIDPETKKPIPVDIFNDVEGLARCPVPFKCSIKPRSTHRAEIIDHEFAAAEEVFVQYEHGLRKEDRAFLEAQRN